MIQIVRSVKGTLMAHPDNQENSEFADRISSLEELEQALTKSGVMPPLISLDFKKMRKAKGFTLREVEEITGVSNPYLSQLETGKIKSPGYDIVKLLYDLYSNES